MAKTLNAKKANRASLKKKVFNVRRKKDMKDSIKTVAKLVTKKSTTEAVASLPAMYQAIDKAAKRGVIKKNTASRMKSRLTKKVTAK